MSDDNIIVPDRKLNNKGFTLIEVLIALAIFSIGILGVATLQISSVNYNSYARRVTDATTRGVETMETLMILPYDADELNPDANPHEIADELYTVNWNVTQDPDLALKTINMTVTWSERGNRKRIFLNYMKSQVI
jgi:prepilin-type N-terminal cleavage/methylation domain-containing protein